MALAGQSHDILHRDYCSQRVGNMRHGDKLGLLAEKTPILIKNYLAVMVDWNHTKPGTDLFTKHLPWNNIGVMFQGCEDDLISCADIFPAICLSDEVNPFGCATHKDDLSR